MSALGSSAIIGVERRDNWKCEKTPPFVQRDRIFVLSSVNPSGITARNRTLSPLRGKRRIIKIPVESCDRITNLNNSIRSKLESTWGTSIQTNDNITALTTSVEGSLYWKNATLSSKVWCQQYYKHLSEFTPTPETYESQQLSIRALRREFKRQCEATSKQIIQEVNIQPSKQQYTPIGSCALTHTKCFISNGISLLIRPNDDPQDFGDLSWKFTALRKINSQHLPLLAPLSVFIQYRGYSVYCTAVQFSSDAEFVKASEYLQVAEESPLHTELSKQGVYVNSEGVINIDLVTIPKGIISPKNAVREKQRSMSLRRSSCDTESELLKEERAVLYVKRDYDEVGQLLWMLLLSHEKSRLTGIEHLQEHCSPSSANDIQDIELALETMQSVNTDNGPIPNRPIHELNKDRGGLSSRWPSADVNGVNKLLRTELICRQFSVWMSGIYKQLSSRHARDYKIVTLLGIESLFINTTVESSVPDPLRFWKSPQAVSCANFTTSEISQKHLIYRCCELLGVTLPVYSTHSRTWINQEMLTVVRATDLNFTCRVVCAWDPVADQLMKKSNTSPHSRTFACEKDAREAFHTEIAKCSGTFKLGLVQDPQKVFFCIRELSRLQLYPEAESLWVSFLRLRSDDSSASESDNFQLVSTEKPIVIKNVFTVNRKLIDVTCVQPLPTTRKLLFALIRWLVCKDDFENVVMIHELASEVEIRMGGDEINILKRHLGVLRQYNLYERTTKIYERLLLLLDSDLDHYLSVLSTWITTLLSKRDYFTSINLFHRGANRLWCAGRFAESEKQLQLAVEYSFKNNKKIEVTSISGDITETKTQLTEVLLDYSKILHCLGKYHKAHDCLEALLSTTSDCVNYLSSSFLTDDKKRFHASILRLHAEAERMLSDVSECLYQSRGLFTMSCGQPTRLPSVKEENLPFLQLYD